MIHLHKLPYHFVNKCLHVTSHVLFLMRNVALLVSLFRFTIEAKKDTPARGCYVLGGILRGPR